MSPEPPGPRAQALRGLWGLHADYNLTPYGGWWMPTPSGTSYVVRPRVNTTITSFILYEKFLQFDWLRAVVFQLNLKYLHVKITNLLRVVV